MLHSKRISTYIINTKKNIGRRNTSSAVVVASTAMVKAGKVTNPTGISRDQFVLESLHSGVGSKFSVTSGYCKMAVIREGSVNVSGKDVPRINLEYNTDEIFTEIDRLNGYDHVPYLGLHSTTELQEMYIEKLINLSGKFYGIHQEIKQFCINFYCQIHIETISHKINTFGNLKDTNEILDSMAYFMFRDHCELNELNFYTMDSANITFGGVHPEDLYDILPKIRELLLNLDSWIYTFNNGKMLEQDLNQICNDIPMDSFLHS